MKVDLETTLDGAVREVRIDQYVVDDCLKGFDFETACEMIAIYAKTLKHGPGELPTPETLRACAANAVLECLKNGRSGRSTELHSWYLIAKYEQSGPLDCVELRLGTISSHGMRPRADYLKGTRKYLEAMGGGWLDEDGRWRAGETPEFGASAT